MGMQDPNKIGFGTIPNTDNFQPTPGQIHPVAPLQAQTAQIDNTLNDQWNQGLPQTQQPAGGFGGTWPQMNAPSMAAPSPNGAMIQSPMNQSPMNFGGQPPTQVPAMNNDPRMAPYANPFLQRAFNQMPGRAPDGTANKYNPVDMIKDVTNRQLDANNAKPPEKSGWAKAGDVFLGLSNPGRSYLKQRDARTAANNNARFQANASMVDAFGRNITPAAKAVQGDFNSNLQDYDKLGGTYGTGANNYATDLTTQRGQNVTARGNDQTFIGKQGDIANTRDANRNTATQNENTRVFQQGQLDNTANTNTETSTHNRAAESNERQKTINANVQMGMTRKEATRKWENEQILTQQKIRNDQEGQALKRTMAEHEGIKTPMGVVQRYPGLDGKTEGAQTPGKSYYDIAGNFGKQLGEGIVNTLSPKQQPGQKAQITPPSKIPEPIKRSLPNIEGALKQFHSLPPDQQKAQASAFQQQTGLNPFEHVR